MFFVDLTAYGAFFAAAYYHYWTHNEALAFEHLVYFAVLSVMTIRMRVSATMDAIKRFNGEGI
ncbi:hypothetical protein [uncultured Sphingomonas sp.]|uniref:hypothetical protein n=1 Tax=uncultured Sphingomonas sp. TaxID=158754 RepID=UPI0026004E0D|nr:hypothetical protein [uncultured Sphingomonas sp.]